VLGDAGLQSTIDSIASQIIGTIIKPEFKSVLASLILIFESA